MKPFTYLQPSSLEETYHLLKKHGEKICLKAGGTDVLIQMRAGQVHPDYLLGMENIQDTAELWQIEKTHRGSISLGAMVTANQIMKSPLLQETYPFFCHSARTLAANQIRNRATLGGNICNASPSADLVPLLICLDSQIHIGSAEGRRIMDLKDFFVAPKKTKLKRGEMVLSIEIPAHSEELRGIYLKHAVREAMDICILGVAATLILQGEVMKNVRICLAAVAPTPVRAFHAETILEGQKPLPELIQQAALAVEADINPISDLRASEAYRREMARVYTNRAILHLVGE